MLDLRPITWEWVRSFSHSTLVFPWASLSSITDLGSTTKYMEISSNITNFKQDLIMDRQYLKGFRILDIYVRR
jgi:hypothetical protein